MFRLILISFIAYAVYAQAHTIYNKAADKLHEAKASAANITDRVTGVAPTPAATALKKQEQAQNQMAYLVRPDVKNVYDYYSDAPAGSLTAQ